MSNNKNTSVGSVDNPWRLPKTVVPKRYEIQFAPDVPTATFCAAATITLDVQERVNEIILNANGLLFDTAFMFCANSKQCQAKEIDVDEETTCVTFCFDQWFEPGEATLVINYRGNLLTSQMRGPYLSKFTDPQGARQQLLSTHCEPADARRIFPCADEPSFKAVFEVTLIADSSLVTVSNTMIKSTTLLAAGPQQVGALTIEDGTGKKVVHFNPTLKMSTYLVAFAVGNLVRSRIAKAGRTEISVYCVPGKLPLTDTALDAAVFSINLFRRYFKCPYPGEKLDLLAVPAFAMGAMENLGCITFRDTALLVDATTATVPEITRVVVVVNHENSHQWFGDWVTMAYWNGTWLNEAMATFFEVYSTDAYRPEWKMWDGFALSRSDAMLVDALSSTRTIEFPVLNPEEAEAMFDVLTYQKGGSVLRQLEQYIGPKVFRQALRLYIAKHGKGNATTSDLWAAFDAASGESVSSIMDAWVFTPGFPMLKVARGEDPETIVISQKRFELLPGTTDNNQLWSVPVLLRARVGRRVIRKKVLLTEGETTVHLGKYSSVVVNAGGHGFYRTIYDQEFLSKLLPNAQRRLSVVERYNLIADFYACVRAGLLSSADYLQMITNFADETDPNVWSAILGSLVDLYYAKDESQRAEFSKFIVSLLTPAYQRLGWDNKRRDTPQDIRLRVAVISALGTIGGVEAVRVQARGLFELYVNPASRYLVNPDLFDAVCRIVTYTGGDNEYNDFLNLMKAANTPQEQGRFRNGLARFRDPELLKRTLTSCLNGDFPTQDAPMTLLSVMQNPIGTQLAWDFVKANFAAIQETFPTNLVIRILEGLRIFRTAEQLADAREFLSSHPVNSGEKAIAQDLELGEVSVRFNTRER